MGRNIFIGGLMKSGTSLLRTLIQHGGHHLGGPETHWFQDDFCYTSPNKIGEHVRLFLEFFELDHKVKLREISLKQGDKSHELLKALFTYACAKYEKEVWVEKTPDNMYQIELILEKFPDANFLLMQRNPYDIYASWKVNQKGSIEDYTRKLSDFLSIRNEYRSHKRCLIVDYEDLIANPQKWIDKVMTFSCCSTFDVDDFSGDQYFLHRIERLTNKKSPTARNLAKPLFNTSIGKWPELLTVCETQMIRKVIDDFGEINSEYSEK